MKLLALALALGAWAAAAHADPCAIGATRPLPAALTSLRRGADGRWEARFDDGRTLRGLNQWNTQFGVYPKYGPTPRAKLFSCGDRPGADKILLTFHDAEQMRALTNGFDGVPVEADASLVRSLRSDGRWLYADVGSLGRDVAVGHADEAEDLLRVDVKPFRFSPGEAGPIFEGSIFSALEPNGELGRIRADSMLLVFPSREAADRYVAALKAGAAR